MMNVAASGPATPSSARPTVSIPELENINLRVLVSRFGFQIEL